MGKPKKPPRPSQPKLLPVKASGPAVDTDAPADPDITPDVTEASPKPCPTPRARSKPKQSDKVPTLVQLQDSVTSLENETSSGKYLKELLEAFSSDSQLDLDCPEEVQENQKDQDKENLTENMNGLHSDRNIRSRIQAFESQTGSDEASTPFPRPRNIYTKLPVVAPKPSIAPRPSLSSPPVEAEAAATSDHYYEEVNSTPQPPPIASKPQLPRKPSIASKEESKPQPPIKPALLPPRPSLARSKAVNSGDDESGGLFKAPPSPLKPSKVLLNLNNHNSTSLLSSTQTGATSENEYVDGSMSESIFHCAAQKHCMMELS